MSIESFYVISDISIYTICVIKLIIYYHNFNILGLGKKYTLTHIFSLIKKIKNKKVTAPIFGGLSMLGALGHGLNGLGLGPALHTPIGVPEE